MERNKFRNALALTPIVVALGTGFAAGTSPHSIKGTATSSKDGLSCRTVIAASWDVPGDASGTVHVEYDLGAVGMGRVRFHARVDGIKTAGPVTNLGAVITRSSRPGLFPVGARIAMKVRDLGSGRLDLLDGEMMTTRSEGLASKPS